MSRMTIKVPFTKAKLRRAIAAAQSAGLRVVAMNVADGTLIFDDGGSGASAIATLVTNANAAASAKWTDVKA